MGSVRAALFGAVALACGLFACGARSSLDGEEAVWLPFDGGATVPVDFDASVDRALDRPPRLEAGCDGEALAATSAPRVSAGPTRLYPVVLHDPSRRRALVLGGLPSSGMFSRAVFAVSTEDGRVEPLGESAVELALEAGVAWIDPGRTAVLIGGMLPGGSWTDRVLRVDVEDARVRFTVVGAHPGGAHTGAMAVFDPARRAVIVHGGRGVDVADPRPFAVTWALRLERGAAQWSELIAGAQSPPAAQGRLGGVDPRTGAVVMLSGTIRDLGFDRRVWSLSAGARAQWTQLEGAADVLARSGSALEWDSSSCGFIVVGGRCADRVWLLRPEGTSVREAVLGAVSVEGVRAGLGRSSAGVVFDESTRTLAVIAGSDCTVNGATIATNALIELR